MAKQAQYVSRPCKALDSPALWDWLATEHPELMAQFTVVFIREVRRHFRGISPRYPKLKESSDGMLQEMESTQ